MISSAGCWKRRLVALTIAASSLTGCTTGDSEPRTVAVCPPVAEYSHEFQARAAEEVEQLRDRSVVIERLVDYAVMREQARGYDRTL